jgi:long-chain acyl-CoA synthetase
MKGYLSNDALNADIFRGNWFHTGDVVEHDADGCYYIVGRSKDIISRGGFKVYPADVERVLRGHQHVADVVVVGVPDVEYGEEIGAVFVLHPDAAIAEEGLRQWIREALPAHNQPRKLLIRDALPITPTGKVVKSAVLEWFQQSAITM